MKRLALLFLTLAAPAACSFLLPDVFGSSGPNPAALTRAVAATFVALTAGAWYARRWAVASLMLGWLLILTVISLVLARCHGGVRHRAGVAVAASRQILA
jgi:hypothetical protein